MQKQISVIIPCLNERENIKACLDSIYLAELPSDLSMQVILVDNGSVDGTLSIVRSFPVEIIQDRTKTISGLRNLGAAHARGDNLAFVDADCIVSKTWIKEAARYFDQTEVILWGAPPVIPENATWVQNTWYLVRQKKEEIGETEWLESMNLFVRKDFFHCIGGFNETLKTAEDVDFCYRAAKKGKIVTDCRIRVVHCGEAADIRSFIKKEIWRGSTNFSGIKSHGITAKELPSLIIPILYGIVLPATLVFAAWAQSFTSLILAVLFYFAPVFAVVSRAAIKRPGIGLKTLIKLFFLIQVYFFSRAVSLAKIS